MIILGFTFTLWPNTVHAKSSYTGGTSKVEPGKNTQVLLGIYTKLGSRLNVINTKQLVCVDLILFFLLDILQLESDMEPHDSSRINRTYLSAMDDGFPPMG